MESLEKCITDTILKSASLCIPKGCRRKYKPIWTKNIEIAVQAREKARKRVERSPTVPNKIAYNRTSAEVKRLSNSSKRETFQKTCSNLDLAKDGNKTWSLINNYNGEDRIRNPKPLKLQKENSQETKKGQPL